MLPQCFVYKFVAKVIIPASHIYKAIHMFIKIYFNNAPLFLCDAITEELEPYLHHDDAVFIDEFSTPSVNTMLHEMSNEKVHAGIFLHPDLAALKKAFWKKFMVIKAAGGIVKNENSEVLFIFRRGVWDLPKGKLDDGETLEECAVREVEEETGLQKVTLIKPLITNYHTYNENGHYILKENYWYTMQVKGIQKLVPQQEEDILELKWAAQQQQQPLLNNAFPSIKDVMKAYYAG
jgi:8-oxo-dGTP pyrophosphatase MutT (NUDIX family)